MDDHGERAIYEVNVSYPISCFGYLPPASFFFGVRIRLGMNFNYLILWVRVKGQGLGFG